MIPTTVIALMMLAQAGNNPAKDIILGKDAAYALMPPELAGGPSVETGQWSGDGQFVLMVTRTATNPAGQLQQAIQKQTLPFTYDPDQSSIVVYNLRTKASTTVWSASLAEVQAAVWLGRSHTALAIVTTYSGSQVDRKAETSLVQISAETGGVAPIARLDDNSDDPWHVLRGSPDLKLAVLETRFPKKQDPPSGLPVSLALISGEPLTINAVSMPPNRQFQMTTFAEDGTPRFLFGEDTLSQRDSWSAFELDGNGGLTASSPTWPRRFEQESRFGLSTDDGAGSASYPGASARFRSVWLHNNLEPTSALLVCAEGASADLAPNEDAVFYQSSGVGFIRRIVPIPKAMYTVALRDAAKKRAIQAAKYVGLAAILYASDNNDTFPSRANFFDSVKPYVRDANDLNGFVYQLNGGFATDLKDPASTVLGYIGGPDGYAVVYADSHVVWMTQPPP